MTAAVSQFLATEFDAIDDYLKAVAAILQDGHMPDLSGLDDRVTELCTVMQTADEDIQQKFLSKMSELLNKLDQCESNIRAFHDAQTKASEV